MYKLIYRQVLSHIKFLFYFQVMGCCSILPDGFRIQRERSNIFEPMKTFETDKTQFDYQSWLASSKIEEKEDDLNELKKIADNLKNENDIDSYLQEIVENFDTFDNYLQVITKPLPQNISKIKLEEGFSQYLITKNLDKEKLVYSFGESSKDDLIKQTKYIWQNLVLAEEITEQNFGKFYEEFLKNVDQLKHFHRTILVDPSKEQITSFTSCEKVLNAIIKFYTGVSNSKKINEALSSKDPILLKRMAIYLNYLAFNSKQKNNVLIGKTIDLKKNEYVYRKITLKKYLANLYRVNDYIFFTNLTSTSKSQSAFEFSELGQDEVRVLFYFKLLSLKTQEKNEFFPGVCIEDVAFLKKEEEVLIMPYQIFLVTNIEVRLSDYYRVYLEEQDDKDLILQIIKPKDQKDAKKSRSLKSPCLDLETIRKSLDAKIEKTAEEKEKLQSDQKKEEERISLESDILINSFVSPSFESCIKNIKLKKFREGNFEALIADLKSNFSLQIFDEFEFKNYFVAQTLHLYESNSTEFNTSSDEEKLLGNNSSFFDELSVEGNLCINFIYIILSKITENLGYKIFYCSSENINLHEDLQENYIYQLVSLTTKRRMIKLSFLEKSNNLHEIAAQIKAALQVKSENNRDYIKACFSFFECGILTMYCETTGNNKSVERFLKDVLKSLSFNFIKFGEVSKSKSFLFHRDMFTMTGNKDYLKSKLDKIELDKRGNKMYRLPVDYKRFSLAVKLGSWLSMENTANEWPVGYVFFDEIDFDQEIGGKQNINPVTNDEYPIVSMNGLQCLNNLQVFEKLSPSRIVEIFDKKFSVAVQCRMRLEAVQHVKTDDDYQNVYVLDRFKSNVLRPYGILVREIK